MHTVTIKRVLEDWDMRQILNLRDHWARKSLKANQVILALLVKPVNYCPSCGFHLQSLNP